MKFRTHKVISYRRWKWVERHLCWSRKYGLRNWWWGGRIVHVVISLWGCPYAALQTCLCGEASRFPEGTGVLTSPQVARRWTCRTEIRQGKNNKAHNYVHIYVNTSYSCTPYLLEQSPSWAANRFSASQEIPHILWNPNVHYHIHKCPPPVPILSQL